VGVASKRSNAALLPRDRGQICLAGYQFYEVAGELTFFALIEYLIVKDRIFCPTRTDDHVRRESGMHPDSFS